MSTTALLVAGINALTAAVVFLFFWFRASYKRLEKKLDLRDVEREKLWRNIAHLKQWAGMLKNCPLANCPYDGLVEHDEDIDGERHG